MARTVDDFRREAQAAGFIFKPQIMSITAKYRYAIEIKTGDKPPAVEWLELRQDTGRRYRYVDRFEAESALEKLQRTQPHATYRIVDLS